MSETVIENLLQQILREISAAKLSRSTWLTIEELSAYIGLKPNTIYQYVHENRIPYNKIPGSNKLLFCRREVDFWIRQNTQPLSRQEIAQNEANRICRKIKESAKSGNNFTNN